VKDPQLQMNSGSLEIRFGENNEIDWIEALTEVRILHEGREAYAGKAVYDVTTDEFLLEDHPKLVDGRNMLLGEKIRFWRATGRMICEPSARIVLYPDDKIKTDFLGN
jgi:lipopolysaccharide export system protein LptA